VGLVPIQQPAGRCSDAMAKPLLRWIRTCGSGFERTFFIPLRSRKLAREPQPVLTTDNGGFTVGQARLALAMAPSLIRNSAVAGGLSAT